jgi:hypothetical protein
MAEQAGNLVVSDAGERGSAADAGCTPVPLFRDRDGDGFGSDAPEDATEACGPMTGLALVAGDCHDAPPTGDDVFPGQSLLAGGALPTGALGAVPRSDSMANISRSKRWI